MSESEASQKTEVESRPCDLPRPMPNDNADFWLTDDELREVGKLAVRRHAIVATIGLLVFWVLFAAGSTMLPVTRMLSLYILLSVIVPVIGGHVAFLYATTFQLLAAQRLSARVRAISGFLVPFGPYLSSFCLGQVDAITNASQGRFVDSQMYFAECAISLREGIPPKERVLKTTLANIYCRAGRFDLAEPLYEQNLESAKKLGIPAFSKAVAYNNLGWIHLLTGKYESAKKALEEAARQAKPKLFDSSDPRVDQLRNKIQVSLARTLIRLGDFERAEVLLQEAFDKATRTFKHVESTVTEAQVGLAELRFCQQRYEEAQIHIRSGVQGYEMTSGSGSAYCRYARQLQSEILKALGRIDESERILLECEIEVDTMNCDNMTRLQQVRTMLSKKITVR